MGSNWIRTNRNKHSGPVYEGVGYNDKTKVTETNISEVTGQLLSNLTLVPPGNISKVHDRRILKKGKKKEEGCIANC